MVSKHYGPLAVTKLQEENHEMMYQTINKFFEAYSTDRETCMSVLMELLYKGHHNMIKDAKVFDIGKEHAMLLEWVSEYLKIRTEAIAKLRENQYLSICTLCNEYSYKPYHTSSLITPKKVKKVEVEGCSSCWTGKGQIITNCTFYDVNDNILLHINQKELWQDTKLIQEKLNAL